MQFESEAEMKELAKEIIPQSLPQDEFEIVPEFDYGNGRTDIVLANVSKPYWNHRINRLNLRNTISDKNHLITFLQLHSKRDPITEDYFYQVGALKKRYKKNALKWLREHGFVVETDSGKIRTAPNLRRHVTTAVAVELKLTKWKDALKQASRGRSFAEYKYVVVDHEHVNPALENVDKFESYNVGLMSMDSAGNCYEHYHPEREHPHSDLYRWKLNERSARAITT